MKPMNIDLVLRSLALLALASLSGAAMAQHGHAEWKEVHLGRADGQPAEYIDASTPTPGTWPYAPSFRFEDGYFLSAAASQKSQGPVELSYRARTDLHQTGASQAPILVLVHGLKDHLDRYGSLIAQLDSFRSPLEVWAYDQPHHGLTGVREVHGEKKPTGAVDSIDENAEHLANFISLIVQERGQRPIFVLGHSMGGLVVANFMQRFGSSYPIRGVILSGPALKTFQGKLDMLQEAVVGKVGSKAPSWAPAIPDFLPNLGFFDRPDLSKQERRSELEQIKNDPYIHDGLHTIRTAAALIHGIEDFQAGLSSSSIQPETSYLLAHGGGDRITNPDGSREFFGVIRAKCASVGGGACAQSELHVLGDIPFHDLPGHDSAEFAGLIASWMSRLGF